MRIRTTTTVAMIVVALFGCVLLLGGCSSDSVAERMARASQYFDSGKFRSATIELKNVLQNQPENAHAWFTLGRVSLAMGQYEDAAHQFRRARDSGASRQQVDRLLAQALIGQGRFQEALEVLTLDTAGDNKARASIYVLRGRAYLGLKKQEQAQQAFNAALQAQPAYPAAWVGQARLAWHAGDVSRARTLLVRAVDEAPTYGRAWVITAALAYSQRRCDDVATVLKHILDLDAYALPPAQVFKVRAQTAFCQLHQGRLKAAAANIDVLMERGPRNPYANYLKALLAYSKENYEQAMVHVQKALAAAPDNLSSLLLSGMIKSARGDLKGAQLQFTDAVTQAPDSLRARQLLASIYMRRGLPEQAVNVLQEALARHGSNPRVLAQLGKASVHAGQTAQGLRYLQLSSDYSVGNIDMQLVLARQMAQAGDVDSALALLERIQSQGDRQKLNLELLEIALYLQNEQLEKALTAVRGLIRQHPDNMRFVRLLARVYAVAGKLDKARNTLQSALSNAPDNASIQLDLGRLAVRADELQTANAIFHAVLNTHPDNVRAMLALGRSAVRQGQLEQAASWFKKAAKLRPDNVGIGATLARVYLAQNRWDKALSVIERVVAAAPDNARLYRLQAAALMAAGQEESALASLKQAIALAPEDLGLRFDLARMLMAQDQLVAATGKLRQIREQHPDSVLAAALLARTQFRQGQHKAALATADSLREHGEHVASAYVLRGELLQAGGKYKEAVAAYAKAYQLRPTRGLALRLFKIRRHGELPHPEKSLQNWLRQHPNDVIVTAALAQWYQVAGVLKAATEQYRVLLAKDPSNAMALNNLALIYFGQGDDRALDLAERAHKAAPQNPAIMDTLGWILVNKGRISKGLPLLRQAAGSTSVPEIQYHLAVALWRSDNETHRAEARTILTTLVASEHAVSNHDEVVKLLEKIRKFKK